MNWAEPIGQVKRMRQWVLDAEHILDGSWLKAGECVSNEKVGRRFDQWRKMLARRLTDGTLSPVEHECLAQFLQVLSNLRPHLIKCYDLKPFPRTNNETERGIRGLKTRYRASVGGRIGTAICFATVVALLSTTGGNKNQTDSNNWRITSSGWIKNAGDNCAKRQKLRRVSNSNGFAFATSASSISAHLSPAGVPLLRRNFCSDGFFPPRGCGFPGRGLHGPGSNSQD